MTLKSYKICSVGTSQVEIERRATPKKNFPLTAVEKLQLYAKHANDNITNAHNELMRANAYSRGLFKITTSDRSTDEKVEDAKALRKMRKNSYDQLGSFLDYVDSL